MASEKVKKNNEYLLEAKIISFCVRNNFLVVKVPNETPTGRPHPHTTPGAPDLIIIVPTGEVFWVEVKTDRGKLSGKQASFIELLRMFGQKVFVVRSLPEFELIIKDYFLNKNNMSNL